MVTLTASRNYPKDSSSFSGSSFKAADGWRPEFIGRPLPDVHTGCVQSCTSGRMPVLGAMVVSRGPSL